MFPLTSDNKEEKKTPSKISLRRASLPDANKIKQKLEAVNPQGGNFLIFI
jgi:hypothetical protein